MYMMVYTCMMNYTYVLICWRFGKKNSTLSCTRCHLPRQTCMHSRNKYMDTYVHTRMQYVYVHTCRWEIYTCIYTRIVCVSVCVSTYFFSCEMDIWREPSTNSSGNMTTISNLCTTRQQARKILKLTMDGGWLAHACMHTCMQTRTTSYALNDTCDSRRFDEIMVIFTCMYVCVQKHTCKESREKGFLQSLRCADTVWRRACARELFFSSTLSFVWKRCAAESSHMHAYSDCTRARRRMIASRPANAGL